MNLPARFRLTSLVTVILALALASACGGSSESKPGAGAAPSATPATAAQAGQGGFQAVTASSELLVGQNRFSLGILDGATGAPVPDAKVHFRFFELHGNQGTLRSEADAVFRAPAREAGIATSVEHVHPDGSIHIHSNAEADVGVYTAPVTFDAAGSWGVQAQVTTTDGRQGVAQAAFNVAASTQTPVPGQPAPRSRQLIAGDVKDLSQIDSSATPDPKLHDMTIADAVASGKPTLVIFASPGYCSSRICGPSVEIVEKMMPKYAGKVNFIHIEVYKDFAKLTPSDTFEQWHLKTEPWFFVIDSHGIISSRFEGPTTMEELDAALGALGA